MKRNVTRKEFQVPSDLDQVPTASRKVLDFLKPLRLSDACLFDVRLCLEEALINAMKYGNELKKSLDVRLVVEADDEELRMTVEDQGKGFDVKKLKDCTKGENRLRECGRGVYLIHQLMDKVEYNPRGNSLLMVKSLRKPVQTGGVYGC